MTSKKRKPQESNKFRRSADVNLHSLAAIHFPVAIRQPTKAINSWTSIIAEEVLPQTTIDQTILHAKAETFEWEDLLHEILILPHNIYWQATVVTSVAINFFLVTYAYYFRPDLMVKIFHEMYITDIIYLLDFIIAVLHKYRHSLKSKIKINKRSSPALIADLISVLPLEMVYYLIFTKSYNPQLLYIFKSVTFIRIYRIIVFFLNQTDSVGHNKWLIFFMKYTFYMCALFHLVACIWFHMACVKNCHGIKTWTTLMRLSENATTWDWYKNVAYFSLSTILSIGYGDLYATNQIEQVFCICAMYLGFTLRMGVYIGVMSSLILTMGKRRAIFVNTLNMIKKHLTDIMFDERSMKKVLDYYNILWVKKCGVKEVKNVDLLPLPLRMEISFDINFGLIKCSMLFRNMDEPFLRNLSLQMRNEFYLPGDIIYHQNVAKYKMICVMSGVLEILSDEDDESPMISFTVGTCLGEISMVLTCPAKASIRAATYTELQVLYMADFLRMMVDNPTFYQQIHSNIMERINSAYSREAEIDKHQVVLNLLVSQSKKHSSIKKLKNHLRAGNSEASENIGEVVAEEQLGIKNDFNPAFMDLYNISENVVEKDGNMCSSETIPWVLQPDSLIAKAWMHLVFCVVVLVCFLYPYYAGFIRSFPEWMYNICVLIDVVYLTDIFITCSTAIEKKDIKILHPKHILWHRMDTLGFYLDTFSILPIELYSYLINSDRLRDRMAPILKLNRLLKAWKIIQYFTILEENLQTNIIFLRTAKYVLYLLLISFWSGVILFMQACFYEPCSDDSWFSVMEFHDEERSPCIEYPYILSIYFALVTLSAVGFGDIVPVNEREMLLIMVIMLFGMLLFGYCIAEFSATFTHTGRPRVQYQETLFAIIEFMHDNKISPWIVERVINYFSLDWEFNADFVLSLKTSLLEDANSELQQEVMAKERLGTICKVPLFQHVDMDFLLYIASGSRVLVLPEHEIITYSGGISREMYIIQEGYCQILNGETGRFERQAGPDSHFGDIEMLFGVPSILTVRTITNCKVINITFKTYAQGVSMFPDIKAVISDIMEDQDFIQKLSYFNYKRQLSFPELNIKYMQKVKSKKRHYYNLSQKLNEFKESYNASYTNNWKICKTSDGLEDYWEPFNKLGNFRFIKYFLLPWTISPTGRIIKVWCTMRFIAAFSLAMINPFYDSIYPYGKEFSTVVVILHVYSYVDMYLMLHVGYYNKQGVLVMHPLKTASHYIQNSFIMDFLACFPFEVFISLFYNEHEMRMEQPVDNMGHRRFVHSLYCIVNLSRVLQIHRMAEAIAYLEKPVLCKSGLINILKFIPYTLVFINVWACMLVTISCDYAYNSTSSKLIVQRLEKTVSLKKQAEIAMDCHGGSWLKNSEFKDFHNPMKIYLLAYYWATETVSGIGFGDITPQTQNGMLLIMMMIILGTLLFGYMFASITASTASLHLAQSQYHEMMNELVAFMDHENVDKDIQKRFIRHFEFEWRRTHGVAPHVIFNHLHTALKEDAMGFMYERTLREVPLFEHVDHSFYRVISKHLRQAYFLRGETVVHSNDVQSSIYIIFHGKVEVLSSYNEMRACMGPGGLFGNIGSVSASICSVTIIASQNLDVLIISSDTFYGILKDYVNVKHKMDTILAHVKDYIMPSTIIDDDSESIVSMASPGGDSGTVHTRIKVDSLSTMGTTTTVGTGTLVTTSAVVTFGTVIFNLPTRYLLMPHNWFKFAILPESLIYVTMSYLVLVASYINCILVTYCFTFQDSSQTLMVFYLCMEAIFYVKIFLQLHQAYTDCYGEYVVDCRKIRHKYLSQRRGLIVDVVANLPVDLIALVASKRYMMLTLSVVRLLHLVRLIYILNFYRIHLTKLMANKLLLKMSMLFIWVSLLVHFMACAWYLLTSPLGNNRPGSWPNYITIPISTPLSAYITCMYYMAGIFTGTGYGDIVPYTMEELFITIVFMVASRFGAAMFIGDITTVLNFYSSTLTNYEYGIVEMRDALRNQSLSAHQMDKMWNYVCQLWKRERGKQMPRLVSRAPFVMRCDFMNATFGHHLRNSYVFRNTNEDFLRQLTVMLKHYVFFAGNYIVQHGDKDRSMYFIHRGEVDVLTVHPNLTETIHDVLKPNDMFGLAQGLYHGLPHHFSFRARTVVDIVTLCLDSWQHMLRYFPDAKEEIYRRASHIYINV